MAKAMLGVVVVEGLLAGLLLAAWLQYLSPASRRKVGRTVGASLAWIMGVCLLALFLRSEMRTPPSWQRRQKVYEAQQQALKRAQQQK